MEDFLIVPRLSRKELRRIFARITVVRETGCWEWTASLDTSGYAQGFLKGRKEKVHRILYALAVGPLPRGIGRHIPQLDHLCRNKICCNPTHLELVTARENTLRGVGITAQQAAKILCKHGHILTWMKNKQRRECRTCDSIRHKRRMRGEKREYWLKKAREAARRSYVKTDGAKKMREYRERRKLTQ